MSWPSWSPWTTASHSSTPGGPITICTLVNRAPAELLPPCNGYLLTPLAQWSQSAALRARGLHQALQAEPLAQQHSTPHSSGLEIWRRTWVVLQTAAATEVPAGALPQSMASSL